MKQHSPDQAHTGKTEGGKSLDPRLTTLEDDGEVVHPLLHWGQPLTTASPLLHNRFTAMKSPLHAAAFAAARGQLSSPLDK